MRTFQLLALCIPRGQLLTLETNLLMLREDECSECGGIECGEVGKRRAQYVTTFLQPDRHRQTQWLDRETYMRDVLSRIADHPINRIEDLLPWNLSAEITQAA